MAPPILFLRDIALSRGPEPLLAGVDMAVAPGERLCVVGRNGSGKSTLLKIAAGLVESDAGTRFVQPGATVRYLAQEPDLAGHATTLAYVEAGLGPGDDPHRARRLLERLGLDGTEALASLSGGEGRRAALARALAPDPDILLLDEPTNHLDLPAIEWLEGELAAMRAALVLISHDRRFLERLSRRTLWIENARAHTLEEGFSGFEAWRDAYLEKQAREAHKLDRKIAMEEDWLRYGVTARRKRNQGRLRALADLRQARREARARPEKARMAADEAELSGKLVIEAKGLAKAYGERAIVRELSLRVARGDRVGLVGANGAGKTTLVDLLTGALAPDSGHVRLGANLEMTTLEQTRDSLEPNATLRETLTGGRGDTVFVGGQPRHVVSYMKDFLFSPDQAGTPVSVLSGGERGRLMLAKALATPSNLLVLDEPTNDLDLETLDLLQETLADYAGTVLLVSHDRDFLDRTVTSVLAAEGEGVWREYAGGYSDMLAQRRAGAETGGAQAPAKADKKEPNRGERAKPAAPKRKLSFKEKHALETLPGEMEALGAEIAEAERALADTGLYAREPERFARQSEALERARARLAAAEEEWLELEILREELEAQR